MRRSNRGRKNGSARASRGRLPCRRADCKHIVAIKLKEKILVMATPTKHPLILVKPAKGHVVISEQEHEEYKKFLEARGTRKAGNQFDEEGRRFRP